MPDIENILERSFNYRVTKLFYFLETSLKINWNSAFETDENGSKMDPVFQLVKGNEPLVIYFLEGGKSAPIRLLASSPSLSRCSKLNIPTGIRTHLKPVSENILLDYKNTKWNTKIPAYEANRLSRTRSGTHLKLCCATITMSIKYCIISYEPSDPKVYFPLTLSPRQIETQFCVSSRSYGRTS